MLRPKRNIRANGKPNYITPEDGFYGSGARNRTRNWVRVALHGAEVGGFGRVGLWGWEFVACLLLGFTMFNPTYNLSRSLFSRLISRIRVDIKFKVWYDGFSF